jgi:serine/threonine protein kinase
MGAEQPGPLQLAISISDGVEVDWQRAEQTAASDQDRRLVQQLAALAKLSRALETSWHESGERWGPFELLERLGGGSFGEVYRARDPRLDTEVALKLLTAGDDATGPDRRAIEEGRLLAKVRHPHVVSVYGADCHDQRIGIWMELVRGRTLAEQLAEHGPFGASEVVAAGRDLCAGLAAVHAAGLIHRDIKAQNVMREAGGRIVLMDLGAGVEVRTTESAATSTHVLTGTPLSMAPELLEGATASVRSDLYALGVLLFHLTTARYPVEGRDFASLRAAHRAQRRIRLRDLRPDLPAALIAAIERAMHPDPAERFGSVGEFEAALAQAVEPRERAAAPERPKKGFTFGLSFGSFKLTLAASLALVFVIAMVVYQNSTDGTIRSPLPPDLDPVHTAGVDRSDEQRALIARLLRSADWIDARLARLEDHTAEWNVALTQRATVALLLGSDSGPWRIVRVELLDAELGGVYTYAVPITTADRAWMVIATQRPWEELAPSSSTSVTPEQLAALRSQIAESPQPGQIIEGPLAKRQELNTP